MTTAEMKTKSDIPITYEQVEDLRKIIGISAAEFCRVTGITIHTYYSWSQPGRVPMGSTAVLFRLMMEDPFEYYAKLRRITDAREKQS